MTMPLPTGDGPVSAGGPVGSPAASPPHHLLEAIALLDELRRIQQVVQLLRLHIGAVADLRPEELDTLVAVGGGAVDSGRVARQVTPAAVRSLLGRGMLSLPPDGEARDDVSSGVLRLTARGTASLRQTEGLQIRALDSLLTALEPDRREALLATSRAVAASLEQVALPGLRAEQPGGSHRLAS